MKEISELFQNNDSFGKFAEQEKVRNFSETTVGWKVFQSDENGEFIRYVLEKKFVDTSEGNLIGGKLKKMSKQIF